MPKTPSRWIDDGVPRADGEPGRPRKFVDPRGNRIDVSLSQRMMLEIQSRAAHELVPLAELVRRLLAEKLLKDDEG